MLSISLPKRGEEDSDTIRNSCENSTESQSQFTEEVKQYLFARPDSPITEANWEESGPGASASMGKVAPVPKRKLMDWPPTVINTRGSSGVIRMEACVGPPRAPSVLIA